MKVIKHIEKEVNYCAECPYYYEMDYTPAATLLVNKKISDAYKLGENAGIDILVEELNNIFEYRHDMKEISGVADKLKRRLNNE